MSGSAVSLSTVRWRLSRGELSSLCTEDSHVSVNAGSASPVMATGGSVGSPGLHGPGGQSAAEACYVLLLNRSWLALPLTIPVLCKLLLGYCLCVDGRPGYLSRVPPMHSNFQSTTPAGWTEDLRVRLRSKEVCVGTKPCLRGSDISGVDPAPTAVRAVGKGRPRDTDKAGGGVEWREQALDRSDKL